MASDGGLFEVWHCQHKQDTLCELCGELARNGRPVMLAMTQAALSMVGPILAKSEEGEAALDRLADLLNQGAQAMRTNDGVGSN